MKKTILRLLAEDHEKASEVKALRKAVCKLHLEIEDKVERKQAFIDILNKLEIRGKIILENSIAKLVRKEAAEVAVDEAVEVEVINRVEKKRKMKMVDADEVEILQVVDKEIMKAKKSKKPKDSSPDNQIACTKAVEEPPIVSVSSAVGGVEISAITKKEYPPIEVQTGDNTILLFYAYCTPIMSRVDQDKAIAFCYKLLSSTGVSGRLRVAREGFNSTLTGPHDSMRGFTEALKKYDARTFSKVDFKFVDQQPDSQLLKGLKVWPVTEIVTYGFNPADAPLEMGGTHLSPQEFHDTMAEKNTVVIDVRNFNETAIGRFQPPTSATELKVLDPKMRRSTEFPGWVEDNKHLLEGKKVLMYCTAGVRCERASAFMRNKGIENVYQLEGGVHRYLDAFPDDGGYWVGKNYTFDKRFSHGAKESVCVSSCVFCKLPWDRYQAQKTCCKCGMEVILCRECQKCKPGPPKEKLICPLCSADPNSAHKKYTARNVLL